MSEIEKTCENCKYDIEDGEGKHCRNCIHNAVEMFEPKEIELYIQAIRNKAIDDFASELENHAISADTGKGNTVKIEFVAPITRTREIAEQLKGGGTDGE